MFGCLSSHRHTAAIRDFPRGLATTEREEILEICLLGLRNCVNLKSCVWTRDGSLSTAILDTLQGLPHLAELEINGHSAGYYDPATLLRFRKLEKITLILPRGDIMDLLPTWTMLTGHSLRHLTLIWEASRTSLSHTRILTMR